VAHITERAAARALVAHDHEGGRAFTETLANIRARRFFAYCVQVVLAQDTSDVVKAGTWRGCLDANPFRLFQTFGGHDLDGNTGRLGLGFLFLGRIVSASSRL
jgi:anti-sigma factor RsiW